MVIEIIPPGFSVQFHVMLTAPCPPPPKSFYRGLSHYGLLDWVVHRAVVLNQDAARPFIYGCSDTGATIAAK